MDRAPLAWTRFYKLDEREGETLYRIFCPKTSKKRSAQLTYRALLRNYPATTLRKHKVAMLIQRNHQRVLVHQQISPSAVNRFRDESSETNFFDKQLLQALAFPSPYIIPSLYPTCFLVKNITLDTMVVNVT